MTLRLVGAHQQRFYLRRKRSLTMLSYLAPAVIAVFSMVGVVAGANDASCTNPNTMLCCEEVVPIVGRDPAAILIHTEKRATSPSLVQ